LKRFFALFITSIAVVAAACSSSPATEEVATGGDAPADAVASNDGCDVYGEFTTVELRMLNERSSHSALLLDDGTVLVVAGRGKGGPRGPRLFPFTEIFDPATGQWADSGELEKEREFFTLITLQDGRILAAGGTNIQLDATKTAEVRDPATGEWTSVGKMDTGRERGVGVLLDDGRVLATGGKNKNLRDQDSTEIFDPTTNEWTDAASMSQARSIHTATVLSDGRVLVVGGGKPDGPFFATAEVYDPATDSWSSTGSMRLPRILHTATLLSDGRVLVVGGKGEPEPGIDSTIRQTSEVWDPKTGEWSPAGSLAEGRAEHTATLQDDGTVLVIGSLNGNTSEIYDPATDTWYDSATMAEARYRHTSTVLEDGTVFVLGGFTTDRVTITGEVFSGDGFSAASACATGVSGALSPLNGIDPVEPVVEVKATPTPTGGSSTSGRDATSFAFSTEVVDAADDEEVTVVPLGTLVTLDVGERMASPGKGSGLTVTFLEVVADSRCPTDVTCITAGETTIKIHVSWFGWDVGELELTLLGGQAEPTITSPGGAFFVAFGSLEPLPQSDSPDLADRPYKAAIAVFQK
jgi:N-acetylneuraminic acid mutarotase